jgi:hypothetical protein
MSDITLVAAGIKAENNRRKIMEKILLFMAFYLASIKVSSKT